VLFEKTPYILYINYQAVFLLKVNIKNFKKKHTLFIVYFHSLVIKEYHELQ